VPARPRGRPRVRPRATPITCVTVDTGWVIAGERDPRRARLHIAALTKLGQVLVVSPIVVVEARQRAGDVGRVDAVLARLEQESITPEDGRRASDLMREAGRQSRDAHKRIHEIGLADALVAALAERLSGIVYTGDPQHMSWLRDAGARITAMPVPF
jgi:predicted nucleic acid-binding protein